MADGTIISQLTRVVVCPTQGCGNCYLVYQDPDDGYLIPAQNGFFSNKKASDSREIDCIICGNTFTVPPIV